MGKGLCGKWAVVLVGAVLILGNPARGQDKDKAPDKGMDDLRLRMERLEKINEQLLKDKRTAEEKKKADEAKKKKEAEEKKKKEEEEKLKKENEFHEVGKDLGLKVRWDYGMWAETENKDFRIHVGGRTQFDVIWATTTDRVQFGKGGIGDFTDGVNFRRGRLEMDGWMYEIFDFFCEYDFFQTVNDDPLLVADPNISVINSPCPTDLWGGINHIPWIGTFRFGNMKPPILLEHLTSSRWLDFMERSSTFDTYFNRNNGFQPGIQILNWTENERMTWQLGLFKNNNTIMGWNPGSGEMQVNGRLTGLPWYENEGRCMIHLGLGVQYNQPDNSRAILRDRWLLRNGPPTTQNTVALAIINGHHEFMAVPEFFMNLGPLSFQAEYLYNHLDDISSFTTQPQGVVNVIGPRKTYSSQTAYCEVMYFLTGEHRPYARTGLHGSGAAPTRVVPKSNFFWVPGQCNNPFSLGAWQVGARYSYADLSNNGIYGGQINEVTLGLNWFLNGNMKVQWNYDIGYRGQLGPGSNSNGTYQGFGTRFAFDW